MKRFITYLYQYKELKKSNNTGFIKVKDFELLKNEEVYNMLLSQYPDWLKAMGIL